MSLRTAKTTERPFPARFVAPLLWGSSLNPVNSSIIATSLVAIATAFGVSAGQTATLVAAVYVASAVAQPAMGRLGAQFGARRVFLVGLGIVTIAGVVGAFAPTFGWLIVSRALIGIGTAAGYPTAMALIRARADEAGTGIPGSVLGGISIAAQTTAALGLPLGGLLVGVWGWPAAFAVNIPLGIVGILMAVLWVPADAPRERTPLRGLVGALDLLGMALFAAAVITLIAFLTDVRHPEWGYLAGFVVAVAALAVWELRAAHPFIDLRMLGRNRPLVRTYLRQALALMASYTVLYGYVQWLEEGRGLPASISGLVMLPMSVVAAVGAGVISRRALVRGPLIVSGVGIILGGAALTLVSGGTNILLLIGLSLVFGVVMGMTSTSNQAALYTQTTAEQIGVASGLARTASYLGAIFASALIALAFPGHATDSGLHTAAFVIVGAGVVVLLLVLLDRRLPWRGH
ncbi:MFS transporter [Microbacterium sp.]|uniref:MFS transporter n=1 Tax=Microbacterium sp. TaxID=51671 RepID=UPI001AC0F022|nr:MFS transporter [Microbacterium sp.]MBN9190318.1 MFS transporter [Microbacterium sp.]MBN9192970.1 MFS transporter [Microbacterium sp.]